ncbi:hypothetical protein [Chromobacterium haemolyticum]|uniref:hypothetical protein n=1 Tax=Chromobacterium haemolyticum TaxID=394935 RepID=UPI0013B412D3|nr:hypothetical protein [Chromobacterium haemolyticum]
MNKALPCVGMLVLAMMGCSQPESERQSGIASAPVASVASKQRPQLGVSAESIKNVIGSKVLNVGSGVLKDGTKRALITLENQVAVDLIGDEHNLAEVNIIFPLVSGPSDMMLMRTAEIVAALAAACPEMEGQMKPSKWLSHVLSETEAEQKKAKPPREVELFTEHGEKRVRYLASLQQQMATIIIEPKVVPAPK